MTITHRVKFILWGMVTAIAMRNHNLQQEYMHYQMRAWNTGHVCLDNRQWLHRRWYPHKYDYEVTCPSCGGKTTSYGLCMDCGERFDTKIKHARPM